MKVFTGKVVAKSMNKTATIAVSRFISHKVYGKRIKRVRNYHVHDEVGVELGKMVKFVASKPYSKTVRWEILGSNKKNEEVKEVKAAKVKTVKKDTKKKVTKVKKGESK